MIRFYALLVIMAAGSFLLLFPVKNLKTVKQWGRIGILFSGWIACALGLYQIWGTPAAIRYSQREIVAKEMEKAKTLRPLLAKFNHKTAELEAELQMNPDQPALWWELSQVYMLQRKADDAFLALKKAVRLAPNNENLAFEFAELSARRSDGFLAQDTYQIVTKLEKNQRYHVAALNLLAMDAYQKGAYALAKSRWVMVKEALNQNGQSTDTLQKVEAALAKTQLKIQRIQPPQFTVTVEVLEHQNVLIDPNDWVFIIAKHPSRLQPLAVIRRRAYELPLTVELGPQHAMLDDWSVAHIEGANIEARISKHASVSQSKDDIACAVNVIQKPSF